MSNGLKTLGFVAVVSACMLLMSASQASAIVVDDFVDGDFTIAIGPGGPTTDVTSTDSGSMIGGWRTTTLHYLSGDTTNFTTQSTVISTLSALIWEQGDAIKGELTVLYDSNGAGLGSGSGVDVTDGGASTQWIFAVLTSGGDGSRFDVTISATDVLNQTSQFDGSFNGYGNKALPFAAGSGSADLTQITSIQYLFDSTRGGNVEGDGGGDYAFELLGTGTIPEPLTMMGMFLGLGGVGAYIRKRRMA